MSANSASNGSGSKPLFSMSADDGMAGIFASQAESGYDPLVDLDLSDSISPTLASEAAPWVVPSAVQAAPASAQAAALPRLPAPRQYQPELSIAPHIAERMASAPMFQVQHSAPSLPGPANAVGENSDATNTLGASLVLTGMGAAVGGYYGGLYGALAGSLFGGAAVNAYRAYQNVQLGTDAGDREAKISATYTLVSGGLGAYVWHRLANERKGSFSKNPDKAPPDEGGGDENESTSFVNRPCKIRPVLPPERQSSK